MKNLMKMATQMITRALKSQFACKIKGKFKGMIKKRVNLSHLHKMPLNFNFIFKFKR